MATRLSVNINKIATLRNARGGNLPNVLQAAVDCEHFGAQGITVHPRPDERHIRYADVRALKPLLLTEFNIEGNPVDSFISLALEVCPHQVTLVPDAHNAITSNTGWNIKKHERFLRDTIAVLKAKNIRTSLFVDANADMVRRAADTGADRVELYTEPYAAQYIFHREKAIADFIRAAQAAQAVQLGVNAGHDLNLDNLAYFRRCIPSLLEVSIGHALISDALYFGLESTIHLYLKQLR
ncbi:MAG: pyridoxine 5'-phosphate synthase [Prevotellaceae bacterium]|jgi:pyridoxine 5-phosphate synthase|nr:pyridoxine 5'-phosphate synthase [Prevotellaceae bacterium]